MQIKIDGKKINCNPNKSLLVTLNEEGFKIPSLCYQEGLRAEAR